MSVLFPQGDLFATWDTSPNSSSAVRPAKTSARPTRKAKASKANAPASSSKPSELSEKSALVGSLLKTALISELGALTPSSMRWRQSATPAGRSWFVLATSVPITSVPGPGSSDAISTKLPSPMATDGAVSRAGGGSGSTYPFRMILATPPKTDADEGFRGDIRAQLDGQSNRHAGMLGTPTSNPAPRGSVLRRMKDKETSPEDAFDRTPNAGEIVHFMLPTPRKSDASHGPEIAKAQAPGATGVSLITTLTMGASDPDTSANTASDGPTPANPATMPPGTLERLPTPTKRDKRMDAWSPAYDKRKSPSMDAVMDGALTDRASGKWTYARMIAAVLTDHGLSGASMTLPLVYGWMMGYPPGWLERALLSAAQEGRLPLVSSSKRTATPSSRKSPKPSAAQS
jgi:hypothetical protein